MTSNGKQVCDRCGHPAAFYDRIREQETCDVCVHADHGERMGERWAAAQMLGAAVQTAVALGMSKAQVGRWSRSLSTTSRVTNRSTSHPRLCMRRAARPVSG